MRGIAIGMNELGPRRCPFAFASAMLEGGVIVRRKVNPTAAHLERMDGGERPRRRMNNLGVNDL
jgi:hypothetical protein